MKCLLGVILFVVAAVQANDVAKRALLYEEGGTSTILCAIAVPVDLENQNVFMALNYAANYGNPVTASHFTDPFKRFRPTKTSRSIREPTVSRESLYRMIVSEFRKRGLDGTACLLQVICDTTANPVHTHNGVLGDVLQIIFSPSLSDQEQDLPEIFYEAEQQGLRNNCTSYDNKCPLKLMELMSILE